MRSGGADKAAGIVPAVMDISAVSATHKNPIDGVNGQLMGITGHFWVSQQRCHFLFLLSLPSPFSMDGWMLRPTRRANRFNCE